MGIQWRSSSRRGMSHRSCHPTAKGGIKVPKFENGKGDAGEAGVGIKNAIKTDTYMGRDTALYYPKLGSTLR